MRNTLKIGDKVWWRGGFGSEPAKLATIEEIEITGGYKYGDQVDEVSWNKVYDRNVVLYLRTADNFSVQNVSFLVFRFCFLHKLNTFYFYWLIFQSCIKLFLS
jgi:hypothetical protein